MSLSVKERFAGIEKMLSNIAGTRKTESMTVDRFTKYVESEIAKASAETGDASTRRLKALAEVVALAKDNYTDDESLTLNVPVYVCDSTALDEKSNELVAPTAAGGSVSENSYFEKFASLKLQVESLAKEFEKDDEEEEKRKKAEAAKAAPPGPPPSARGDVETAEDDPPSSEDEETKRAKAAAAKADGGGDIAEGDDATKDKTKKSLDVSPDGTGWPSDMNDPSFTKDGKVVEKSLEWGKDS